MSAQENFPAPGSGASCEPVPRALTVHVEGDQSFEKREDDTILRAALRAGIGFPYECNSGGCGTCKFDLCEGTVEQLWPDAPGLTERDRRKNKLLACQVRPTSDIRIKVRCRPEYCSVVKPERRRVTLSQVENVTHDIREFRFKTDAGSAEFLTGQYAMLRIPGVDSPRAYSMSNTGNAAGDWHFQIRRVPHGKATGQLFDSLQIDDSVDLDGPYGLAYLRQDNPRDIVCIAGGSGLAPMVSIARGAAESGMLESRSLHFFYGGRTPRDICAEKYLRGLSGFGERVHFYPVVSLPEPSHGWTGQTGFVHERVRHTLGASLRNHEIYFAGPPPMTQSISDMLIVEMQVPFGQIHFDRFF